MSVTVVWYHVMSFDVLRFVLSIGNARKDIAQLKNIIMTTRLAEWEFYVCMQTCAYELVCRICCGGIDISLEQFRPSNATGDSAESTASSVFCIISVDGGGRGTASVESASSPISSAFIVINELLEAIFSETRGGIIAPGVLNSVIPPGTLRRSGLPGVAAVARNWKQCSACEIISMSMKLRQH